MKATIIKSIYKGTCITIVNQFNVKKITKALAAIMLMTVVMFTTGCKKDNADGDGTVNGHTYVDLGLPSGTLWAACNVGANSPEEYGDYFAWGETQPKETYDWSTYQYCNGSIYTLTKYCNVAFCGNNGFIDNLTVLQPMDDAATANWGNGWCTPTDDQWRELIDNTIASWITQNGVNGRLFTASNGNSLFLPAAGFRWGLELDGVSYFGGYWLSSLDTGNPSNAWYFNFGFGSGYCGGMSSYRGRGSGLSVRAVHSARQN